MGMRGVTAEAAPFALYTAEEDDTDTQKINAYDHRKQIYEK
jgi:hypothetical protein